MDGLVINFSLKMFYCGFGLGRAGIDGILMIFSDIGAILGSLEIHLTSISTKIPAKSRI
jgi:hypothetical protein